MFFLGSGQPFLVELQMFTVTRAFGLTETDEVALSEEAGTSLLLFWGGLW
jgi:hypothetical protein